MFRRSAKAERAPPGGAGDAADEAIGGISSTQASEGGRLASGEVPRLAFFATEDWFFASHFLPMIRAARRAGFEPIVIVRVRDHRAWIEAAGARVVALEADRRSLDPLLVLRDVARLRTLLRRERIAVAHCISLRPIVVGGLAAHLAGVPARVFAVTGGGHYFARSDRLGRLTARLMTGLIRRLPGGRRRRFLFENRDDPVRFGLAVSSPDVVIVGGAGVDPAAYPVVARPQNGPLRVAVVARMLWSKGIDLAVEAVRLARAEGAEIELSLFGAPDPDNPRALPLALLQSWNALGGIRWEGATLDVPAVWAGHDLACLPSRGGEGLPRALLEAAASGRAILTTDVPGCRDFVRHGIEGLVVPRDDVEALKAALLRLAGDRSLLSSMQAKARARVTDVYTEASVEAAVETMYRDAMAHLPKGRRP